MRIAHDRKLEKLLNDLADGGITSSDEQLLAELLRNDPEARLTYRQFMGLHADLHWDYVSVDLPRQGRRLHSLWQRYYKAGRRAIWELTAAAVLIITAGVFIFNGHLHNQPVVEGKVLGRITPVVGVVQICRGKELLAVSDEVDFRADSSIHVVGLTGLALLRFNDGTEISLAGETRLECRKDNEQIIIMMHQGNISADVSPQKPGHPLVIHTDNTEISVLGTRLALSVDGDNSQLGVQHGRVRLKRLADGKTIEVIGGEYAVVSQRGLLESRSWPETTERWSEDFEDGLPCGWRFGQWLKEQDGTRSRGVVRAARRFALNGEDTEMHRITLPKQWMQGLWRIEEDSVLSFTYKMEKPGWFEIMMGMRSDDLNPEHVGNSVLHSSYWDQGLPNQWRTVSVPFSAFKKNIRGVPYPELPLVAPRVGDVVYILWFSTGVFDRGLTIDRIWVERESKSIEEEL